MKVQFDANQQRCHTVQNDLPFQTQLHAIVDQAQ